MRPRFRSYGESSTATLSPGRMRMKFLRIFPETCASTWCLFSSSTLNMALGSGSTTVAITSIASSLLMHSLALSLHEIPHSVRDFGSGLPLRSRPLDASTSIASSLLIDSLKPALGSWLLAKSPELKANSCLLRQNHRAIFCDRDAVLEVGAVTAIGGYGGPLVFQNSCSRMPRIHHGLDCQHHAFTQTRSVTASGVGRHLGLSVQARSDAMPHKSPHHAEAVGFH